MKNYERILKLKVFNLHDICELTGNINTAKSLIRNLLLFDYIKRVNTFVLFDATKKHIIYMLFAT